MVDGRRKEEERKERDGVGRWQDGKESNLGGGKRGRTGEKRKEPTDEGATVLLPTFAESSPGSTSPLTARVSAIYQHGLVLGLAKLNRTLV